MGKESKTKESVFTDFPIQLQRDKSSFVWVVEIKVDICVTASQKGKVNTKGGFDGLL